MFFSHSSGHLPSLASEQKHLIQQQEAAQLPNAEGQFRLPKMSKYTSLTVVKNTCESFNVALEAQLSWSTQVQNREFDLRSADNL